MEGKGSWFSEAGEGECEAQDTRECSSSRLSHAFYGFTLP